MFKRQFQKDYKGMKGQENPHPSLTVPDQAIPLRTLLLNHTRGIPIQEKQRKGEFWNQLVPNITDLIRS